MIVEIQNVDLESRIREYSSSMSDVRRRMAWEEIIVLVAAT
jgi:hypothetical protein